MKFERYNVAATAALIAGQIVSETVVREQGHTVSEAARAVRESHAVKIAALSQIGLVDEDGNQIRKPYSQSEIGILYGMSKATAERVIRLGIILTTHESIAEGTMKKIRNAINSSEKNTRINTEDALRIAEATASPATTLAEILAEKAASNEAGDTDGDNTDGEGSEEETPKSPEQVITDALKGLRGAAEAVDKASTLADWTLPQLAELQAIIATLRAAGATASPQQVAA